MKTCIFILCLAFSSFCTASTKTNYIMTSNGSTIYVGDTFKNLMQKIHASPTKMRTYTLNARNEPNSMAIDYTYEIENYQYIVTIINNRIDQIFVRNMNR